MRLLTALFSGLIFGLGLIVSGMTNPAKIQNFLDLYGTWDPSLVFVMGGAIAVAMPGFLLIRRQATPFFHTDFHLPTRSDLDPSLLTGAAIFGVGWGLGGYCPGPAITALPMATTGTLVWLVAMLGGMWLAKMFRARQP